MRASGDLGDSLPLFWHPLWDLWTLEFCKVPSLPSRGPTWLAGALGTEGVQGQSRRQGRGAEWLGRPAALSKEPLTRILGAAERGDAEGRAVELPGTLGSTLTGAGEGRVAAFAGDNRWP